MERPLDPAPTAFAPAERLAAAAVATQHAAVLASSTIGPLLECFPGPTAVLNAQRQIVAANAPLLEMLGADEAQVLGRRPGEVFDCVHAGAAPGGCGTTDACRACGAVLAILGAQAGDEPSVEHCRLRRADDGGEPALDLRVRATPVEIGGERFVVFAVEDTGDARRREVLERIFFHDAINMAGGLQGLAELIREGGPAQEPGLTDEMVTLARQFVEEIQAQRDLAAAERGDLRVQRAAFDAAALLEQVARTYRGHAVGRGRTIDVRVESDARVVETDLTLLRRVLGNLVKNALEASAPGRTVTLGYRHDGTPRFFVHNEAAMDEEVRRQVFQRSFSTRGERGRGIGLYSVRLLSERYLGGRVAFRSTGAEGTVFTVSLPA